MASMVKDGKVFLVFQGIYCVCENRIKEYQIRSLKTYASFYFILAIDRFIETKLIMILFT